MIFKINTDQEIHALHSESDPFPLFMPSATMALKDAIADDISCSRAGVYVALENHYDQIDSNEQETISFDEFEKLFLEQIGANK